MRRFRSVGYVALAALLFGIAMAAVKGDQAGLRGQVGNLSAPWLLVAFLPSLRCRTPARGAATGLISTLVALAGFYATLTVVLAGQLHGGGYLRELAVEVSANRVYFVAGTVTGPLMGLLGAWVGTRHPAAAAYVVGALVATETAAVALVQGRQLAPPPFYFSWGVDDWRPYLAETLVGVVVITAALWRTRRLRRAEGASA
jgi:hypothetical protein